MGYQTKQGRLAAYHKRRIRLVNYLKARCVDCGQHLHAAVFTFRYRPNTTRAFNIDRALQQGMSLSKLLDEVKKCDLVCSNCQAVQQWAQDNSFIRST